VLIKPGQSCRRIGREGGRRNNTVAECVNGPLIRTHRGRIIMRKPMTRKRSKPPTCDRCGVPLETAVTAQNPSAAITANSLARCPTCMVLFVIGNDLLPVPDSRLDEDSFDAAMNANAEIKEWTLRTLETLRIRAAVEVKAECAVAREWLIAHSGPELVDDLAALDTYTNSFDERGFTHSSHVIRRHACSILGQMERRSGQ
jgi:hypothetical protein